VVGGAGLDQVVVEVLEDAVGVDVGEEGEQVEGTVAGRVVFEVVVDQPLPGRLVSRRHHPLDVVSGEGVDEGDDAAGEVDLTAPFKPFLEEKLWSAFFWMRPLRDTWRRELRDSHWRRLQEIIPYSWVMNPETLPPHAAIPRLEINDFTELKQFSQQERDLVLKISGFSELGWGSRSVTIGSDSSQEEWSAAVGNALDQFGKHPYVLQEFHKGRRVAHPFWKDDSDSMEILEGRVRLCPYYFVDAGKPKQVQLGGVLATICPADKKILHGMKDAILVPCCVSEDGY